MLSAALRMMLVNLSSLSRSDSWACLRAVMSWAMPDSPMIFPAWSLMGEIVTATSTRGPVGADGRYRNGRPICRSESREISGNLAGTLGRNKHGCRFPNRLDRRVAIEALGAGVPGLITPRGLAPVDGVLRRAQSWRRSGPSFPHTASCSVMSCMPTTAPTSFPRQSIAARPRAGVWCAAFPAITISEFRTVSPCRARYNGTSSMRIKVMPSGGTG